MKKTVRVTYRFPKPLPQNRPHWMTYDCTWSMSEPLEIEVASDSHEDFMQAIKAIPKADNGCDAMKIEARYLTEDGMEVEISRKIDMYFHTVIFHDGRKIYYWTNEEDIGNNTTVERFNDALSAAGYRDLIAR